METLAPSTSTQASFRVTPLHLSSLVITLDYVLRTSLDKHYHLGFTFSPRLSSRYPPEQLTDVDYADDVAITADTITNGTVLLHNLGNAANEVGLYVNASKNLLASTSKVQYKLCQEN